MQIKVLQVGPIGTNCYLLEDETSGAAGVVDPGGNGREIMQQLDRDGVKPVCILLTHAHFDHTGGVDDIAAQYPDIPVYLHHADAELLGREDFPAIRTATTAYKEGDRIPVGSLMLQVIETPGHTPGGVTLMVENQNVLFTGDTLFQGSMGRTDFYGGSYEALMGSLKKLALLEGDYHVLPGHMNPSTMERERQTNYFLAEACKH